MKPKLLAFAVSLFFAPMLLCAQGGASQENDSDKSRFLDKIYIGGNFGLQLGTYTYIDVSPLIGYRFTDRFSAGPGITYRYFKVRGYESSSIYGGRFFARHTIGRQFFAHTEYENLNTEVVDFTGRELAREWVPGFFIGGGIIQPLGRRGAVVIYGLYNLLYDNLRSPYPRPWIINVGFTL